MDKKEKQKLYYQQNRERIIEKAKEYYKIIKKKDKNIIKHIGKLMGTNTLNSGKNH